MYENIQRWTLIRRKGAKLYQLRYVLKDGTVREKATKETVRRQAERRAMEILKEIDEAGCLELYGWHEFCSRYEVEHLGNRPFKTREAFRTAIARFDSLCSVRFVGDITSQVMVTFAVRLRAESKSEATIQAYRDHIMASLRWAEEVGVIKQRPKPPRLSRVPTGSRGRPLTLEEFERFCSYLPEVVGDNADRWKWNLQSLWLSGFRLGETFCLHWEKQVEGHYLIGLDTSRPKVFIDQNAEKAFRNRVLPLTPDFAAHLRTIPANRRNGTVWKWPLSRGYTTNAKTVGKRISLLGRLAKIKTGRDKHASAHDLRRSFGARWAVRVQPFVLRTLMRHASVTTTERFYLGNDADRVADALYTAEDTGLEPAADFSVPQFQ
jgi:integrase